MNEIINELFEDKNIEMIFDDEKGILFEIYSTGMALGYINKRKSNGKEYITPYKSRIDKVIKNAEIKCVTVCHNVEISTVEQFYITEDQLYDFMLEARTNKCKDFRKWVTKELLPKLRKEGYYISDNINEEQIEKLKKDVRKLERELEHERTQTLYTTNQIVKRINVDGLLTTTLYRYLADDLHLGTYNIAIKNRTFKPNRQFKTRVTNIGAVKVAANTILFSQMFADNINKCECALERLRELNQEELTIKEKGIENKQPF